VEKIIKRVVTLTKRNCKIEFKWVKAQAGIYGKEIADRLAKETTENYHVTYSRIPNRAIIKDNRKESNKKIVKTMGGNKKRSGY